LLALYAGFGDIFRAGIDCNGEHISDIRKMHIMYTRSLVQSGMQGRKSTAAAEYHCFNVISKGCCVKVKAKIKNRKKLLRACHAYQNSATFNEGSRCLGAWRAVFILEFFACC